MRTRKSKVKHKDVTVTAEPIEIRLIDPNELLEKLLTKNNLRLDFDALEGTVVTKSGIIKLDKPVLAVKASYV